MRGHAGFLRYEVRAFIYAAGLGIATPLLPILYVSEIHAPNAWIGIIGGAQSVGGVLGYILARRAYRRRGSVRTLLPAMLVAAIVPAAMGVASLLGVVVVLAFVAGISSAGTQLGLFNEFMKRVPRARGVTFSSVDATIQNVALIVGPFAGGVLAATIGVREGLEVAAVVTLTGFILFALDGRRHAAQARPV